MQRAVFYQRGEHWGKESGYIFTTPKSQGSDRRIDMSPQLKKILKEHWLAQDNEKNPLGLTFPNKAGKPIEPDNFCSRLQLTAGQFEDFIASLIESMGHEVTAVGKGVYCKRRWHRFGSSAAKALPCSFAVGSSDQKSPAAAQKDWPGTRSGAARGYPVSRIQCRYANH